MVKIDVEHIGEWVARESFDSAQLVFAVQMAVAKNLALPTTAFSLVDADGKELEPWSTIEASGIKDGDTIAVELRATDASSSTSAASEGEGKGKGKGEAEAEAMAKGENRGEPKSLFGQLKDRLLFWPKVAPDFGATLKTPAADVATATATSTLLDLEVDDDEVDDSRFEGNHTGHGRAWGQKARSWQLLVMSLFGGSDKVDARFAFFQLMLTAVVTALTVTSGEPSGVRLAALRRALHEHLRPLEPRLGRAAGARHPPALVAAAAAGVLLARRRGGRLHVARRHRLQVRRGCLGRHVPGHAPPRVRRGRGRRR